MLREFPALVLRILPDVFSGRVEMVGSRGMNARIGLQPVPALMLLQVAHWETVGAGSPFSSL